MRVRPALAARVGGRARAARAAALVAWTWAGCAGPEATAPEPAPAAAGPPQPLTFEVRSLLDRGEPRVSGATLVLDGVPRPAPGGVLALDIGPGPHSLLVRHDVYRADLFAVRFQDEDEPRAQAVGTRRLDFEVRPGDARAQILLARRTLDVPFLRSLLDEGVARRWPARVDLHVDRSPTTSGFAFPAERVEEVAVYVRALLEAFSAGAVTLGEVTVGTGLEPEDFLRAERHGAITLQFADVVSRTEPGDVGGWGLYRRDTRRPGLIRSANLLLRSDLFRDPARGLPPLLGHEIGHALGLRHPTPCRRWSRMDPGTAVCDPELRAHPIPGVFWSPADLEAGKLLYAFRPGTDFSALPPAPPR